MSRYRYLKMVIIIIPEPMMARNILSTAARKEALNAPEEVLLDVDELAKGHAYYSAAGFNVSPDNKLLAYGVDTVSRREYIIYIKNLESGEIMKYALHLTTGGSVWAADNTTLFYYHEEPGDFIV